ncbi:hypothetical protein BpHYR1_049410 [Brachionus plicatilis]|uniref:Uncharacterized protein n=1 Tax=Brachionus plicatilis TaxID=10195 RepID=A0A3M7SC88_BRAPC|nr:hypothetical protein BpHYR1_049410 [Brachionus plicatilis]
MKNLLKLKSLYYSKEKNIKILFYEEDSSIKISIKEFHNAFHYFIYLNFTIVCSSDDKERKEIRLSNSGFEDPLNAVTSIKDRSPNLKGNENEISTLIIV